ncbi:MAG: hypothetical protein KatS3mg105_2889 [Gemmatales bacterium]|nr:MAG: hypothetical protein KatS3mg105_2889 [Gemmatales bacterium]
MDALCQIAWEETNCPLCGQRREKVLLETRPKADHPPYRVVQCGVCEMGYLNPRPTPETVGLLYPDNYECYQPRGESGREPGWKRYCEQLVWSRCYGYPPPLRSWYERLLARMVRPWFGPSRDSMTAIPYTGKGRLLDFGCGAGWLLTRMKERGWSVAGLDFSSYTAQRVQKRLQIPVYVGTLPHPEIAAESFDVVTMGAVLEHVHDPHAVISGAARILAENGLIVISVPNIASCQFDWFQEDCWSLELPRHLLHFSPATITRLVRMHGFEVVQLRLLGRTSWMRRSVEAALARPKHKWWLRAARLRPIASLLTSWTVFRGRSDCLMLIARKVGKNQQRCSA